MRDAEAHTRRRGEAEDREHIDTKDGDESREGRCGDEEYDESRDEEEDDGEQDAKKALARRRGRLSLSLSLSLLLSLVPTAGGGSDGGRIALRAAPSFSAAPLLACIK